MARRGRTKRELLKEIARAIEAAEKEISGNALKGGTYGRGLANEGYSGGYLAALRDVEAQLLHGYPTDERNYWGTKWT